MSFQVADHEFTRFSIIPAVSLIIDVPGTISASWYEGNAHVLYKDSAFEPSSPIRHARLPAHWKELPAGQEPTMCPYGSIIQQMGKVIVVVILMTIGRRMLRVKWKQVVECQGLVRIPH